MAKAKKNTAATIATAAENAAVELSTPAVEKTATTVSNSVIVALNNPAGITFDLSGNRRVTLNGNAENLRGLDKGHIPVGRFGYSTISRADWNEIREKYGTMRVFRHGLCFAADTLHDAEAEAMEKQDTRHGREPVDPKNDPQLKGRVVETSAPAE